MKWINVKDQLPEQGVLVLTYGSDEFQLDYLVLTENNLYNPYIWANQLVDEWEKVTYWQTLPKKPEIK